MWRLIGLGTGAAFRYRVVATDGAAGLPIALVSMGRVAVYFEAAVVTSSLTLFGQKLELKLRPQISAAIKALLGLALKTARRIEADGSEADSPLSHVHVGDQLRVRPGKNLPVDGAVIEGGSTLDASMLTSEPMAVSKHAGNKLIDATLNTGGARVMRYEHIGSATMQSQIVRPWWPTVAV